MKNKTKHLWEVKHSYYCNEANYYAPANDQPHQHYESWEEFITIWGDADKDYNLLFRWDWEEDDEKPKTDEYSRNGTLKLFWMGQRKGLYQWSTVEVCRADEQNVKKFLRPFFTHLKGLWEPFV